MIPERFALLLAMTLLAPGALAGQDDYAAGEPATGFHTQKKMTRSPDGTLYYTFLEKTEVVVSNVDGTRLPGVQAARGGQSRSSITFDANGGLHLAWTERADEDREVFAARLVDGKWRDVTQLSRGEGYAGFPTLAADRAGRVHVAWYGFDGDFYQTFHRVWEEGAWSNATQLSAGPLDANNPSLVVAADGTAHVAWYKDEGRRYSVWHASRAPDGTWALAERLPQGEAGALNVALALGANETLHAVWDERHEDGAHVMHATRGADGWSDPETIARGDAGGEYPAIARYGDDIIVAWTSPNGTILAWEPGGAPFALAGGLTGTHVSLRGAQAAPAGDVETALDILYTDVEGRPRLAGANVPEPAHETPAPALLATLVACLLALRRRTSR